VGGRANLAILSTSYDQLKEICKKNTMNTLEMYLRKSIATHLMGSEKLQKSVTFYN
jgi:hypothetical protein